MIDNLPNPADDRPSYGHLLEENKALRCREAARLSAIADLGGLLDVCRADAAGASQRAEQYLAQAQQARTDCEAVIEAGKALRLRFDETMAAAGVVEAENANLRAKLAEACDRLAARIAYTDQLAASLARTEAQVETLRRELRDAERAQAEQRREAEAVRVAGSWWARIWA